MNAFQINTNCTKNQLEYQRSSGVKWADMNKPQCPPFGEIIEAKSPSTNDLLRLQQQD